jgi:hypothetical protein
MTNFWRASAVQQRSGFKVPEDTAKIWRYMGFNIFEDLLDNSALFFANTKLFVNDDSKNGKLPKIQQEGLDKVRETYKEEFGLNYSYRIEDIQRNNVFANSWTVNPHECKELWTKNGGKQIAIQSTFGRFKDSFGKYNKTGIPLYVGTTEYLDKDSQRLTSDSLAYFWQKDPQYAKEIELRAIADFQTHFGGPSPCGVHVYVDLPTLIENVFVSSLASRETRIIIDYLLDKHRLNRSISSGIF